MKLLHVSAIVGLTLMAWAPASAQTQQTNRPERPYRGVFAGGMDDSGQSLVGNATFSGGYDDNILAHASSTNSIQNAKAGGFAQFSGNMEYTLNASRGSFNAMGGTSQRYYPTLDSDYLQNYMANVGGTWQVTAKPSFVLHQSAGYQPHTFLSAFPMELDPAVASDDITDPDVVPVAHQYFFYEGGAALDHQMSQRTTFSTSWDYRAIDRDTDQFWRQTATTAFVVGMTRDLNLRMGYSYTQARHDDRVTEIHRPDIGLEFRHALSLTRRTSFSFGTGTEASVYNGTTRFNITGSAQLVHEMGRSWTTTAAYQRGTYFVDTFGEPLTGDSASWQLGGLITRRVQLQAVAAASIGQMGYSESHKFDSYRGTVTLSTALTRYMKLGLNYAYYRYKFNDPALVEPGLSSEVNRQSIRGQVSFWAPFFTKARSTNASR